MHALDALEHAEIQETSGTVTVIVSNKLTAMTLDNDLKKVAASVLGPAVKIQVKVGAPSAAKPVASATGSAKPTQAPTGGDSDAIERALAHPEVKKFQEAFPDGQIRQVRDLRE